MVSDCVISASGIQCRQPRLADSIEVKLTESKRDRLSLHAREESEIVSVGVAAWSFLKSKSGDGETFPRVGIHDCREWIYKS